MENTVYAFNELKLEQRPSAGGKGGTLARLYQKGYPVPDGFIIFPSAFIGDEISPEIWAQVQTQLQRLRKTYPGVAFAVRSSAVAEDSALASFAGEFETVLNVSSDEEIRISINTVRQSRNSERVKAYSQSQGVETVHEMAVVIQRMIQPEMSGVLFTAAPVTSNRNRMAGNYIHGLGDRLVSGETEAAEFTIQRYKYKYEGPSELKQYHRKLYKLAKRLEKDLGCPQDIEWAVSGNKVYILQSRPISIMIGFNPVTGESNDTLTGDFVWTCVNTGEALPDVMTPLTWSGAPLCYGEVNIIPEHEMVGNIGGRVYQNSTVVLTMYKILRQDVMSLAKEVGGAREEYANDMERYVAPLEGISVLPLLPRIIRLLYKTLVALKGVDTFITDNPGWCRTSY
ncbi:PEP/pyruvate-binding domain-containing protein [Chloroflexota bacterium]